MVERGYVMKQLSSIDKIEDLVMFTGVILEKGEGFLLVGDDEKKARVYCSECDELKISEPVLVAGTVIGLGEVIEVACDLLARIDLDTHNMFKKVARLLDLRRF
ncbi:MAG: hypothetical protein DRN96_02290 [Thermoproteota archaeon]|nr:MAG: hypothetical protein DRN99_08370 [Candidatus Korarchaeota archaeon]RLG52583.1 MAG: hypothetical protein DRN96_02290 [Candidatus Korarchaeota archaeon]